MILDGSGDINFPSNEPYKITDSDDPEKVNNNKEKNPKKKCLIIILIIGIIIVLAVGIFLAIYFGLKKKEEGGSIIATFEYPKSATEKIFGEGFNIDEKDFEIEEGNSRRKLLNMPIKTNRKLAFGEHEFKQGTNELIIKFNKPLTSLEGIFQNRKKLVSINFSDLNTKKIININKFLSNCTDLEEAIFNNFEAKNLEKMEHSFENSSKLTILDLSYFSTPKLTSINSAFKGCKKLLALNLKNFIFDAKININNVIDGCDSLVYIDLPKDNEDIIKPNNNLENITQCMGETYSCEKCGVRNLINNINISVCLNCTHGYYKSEYSLYPIKCEPCLKNCTICNNGDYCIDCDKGYYPSDNGQKCIKYSPPSDLIIDSSTPIMTDGNLL